MIKGEIIEHMIGWIACTIALTMFELWTMPFKEILTKAYGHLRKQRKKSMAF